MEPRQEAGAAVPRILGVDVGDRRIGLAISDPLGYTAQPLFTLHRTSRKADLKSVARVLRMHGVTEAVIGNPLYMSGDQSPQAAKARAFARGAEDRVRDRRASVGRTVDDHRGAPTSERRRACWGRGRKAIIDQVAAVLILQPFLEAPANQMGAPNVSSAHSGNPGRRLRRPPIV